MTEREQRPVVTAEMLQQLIDTLAAEKAQRQEQPTTDQQTQEVPQGESK